MQFIKKIKDSFLIRLGYINYTLRHKVAFLQVEKKLRGKNTLSGYLHDLDKVFLYMVPWFNIPKSVQNIHRKWNRHHVECRRKKSQEDRLDSVIDWACASLTKPDKPLNAYETLLKFYPDHIDEFLPLIQKYLPEQIQPAQASQQMVNMPGTVHDSHKNESLTGNNNANGLITLSKITNQSIRLKKDTIDLRINQR